ncbi:MAG: hypothetical protein LBU65_17870 [Planctomycetaceae bacterium]|jgi:tetratricopeptide (TPR) repeat protein|nr:hypothetical protein [Planctomycetaceae bacterium]
MNRKGTENNGILLLKPIMKHTLFSIIFLFAYTAASAAAFADDSFLPVTDDVLLVRGLLERGLLESGLTFTDERLADATASPDVALLLFERLNLLTAFAFERSPELRSITFDRFIATSTLARSLFDGKPELLLVESQIAVSTLNWCSLACLESVLNHGADSETKIYELRDATQKSETIRLKVEQLRDSLARETGGLSRQQCASLELMLRYEQGKSYLNLAVCSKAGEADYVDAIEQAKRCFESLAGLRSDDVMVLRSVVGLAGCYRQLRSFDSAQTTLDLVRSREKPLDAAIKAEVDAEQIRIFLAKDDLANASKLVSGLNVVGSNVNSLPELLLAQLEVTIAIWKREPTDNRLSAALSVQRQLEQRGGVYWGRRGQILLTKSSRGVAVNNPTNNAQRQLVEQLASDAFRSGQFETAIVRYDEAAGAARAGGELMAALLLTQKAASIRLLLAEKPEAVERNRLLTEAADSLRKISLAFADSHNGVQISNADNVVASECHLQSLDLTARLVQTGAKKWGDYVAVIDEHVSRWHDAKETALRLRAAEMLITVGQYRAALRELEPIPVDATNAMTVIKLSRQVFDGLAKNVNDSGGRDGLNDESGRWFLKRVPAADVVLRSETLVAAAEATVSAAEKLLSGKKVEDAAKVQTLLVNELKRQESAVSQVSQVWFAKARLLLALALANQGKNNEALTIFEKLERDIKTLPAAEQREVALSRAAAFTGAGQTQRAVEIYVGLLKNEPEEPRVLEQFADLLTMQADSNAWALGLKLWKRLENATAADTEKWWTAKAGRLRVLVKQGKKAEAVKELELWRTLYPELGGMKAKLEGTVR